MEYSRTVQKGSILISGHVRAGSVHWQPGLFAGRVHALRPCHPALHALHLPHPQALSELWIAFDFLFIKFSIRSLLSSIFILSVFHFGVKSILRRNQLVCICPSPSCWRLLNYSANCSSSATSGENRSLVM